MSGFTKEAEKTYQFDGDEVVVKYSNLSRGDMMVLAPVLPKTTTSDDGEQVVSGTVDLSQSMEMMDVAAGIMKNRIKSMAGLNDSDGNNITKDVMLNEVYFVGLASDILADMMNSSFLKEEDAKN